MQPLPAGPFPTPLAQGQRLYLTVRKDGPQVTLVGPTNSAKIIFPDIPMCQGYLHGKGVSQRDATVPVVQDGRLLMYVHAASCAQLGAGCGGAWQRQRV